MTNPKNNISQMSQADQSLTTEEKLLKIIERQKYITDNVPSLIAYWDKDQRCRFANKPYFEWFGFSPEKLYGLTMPELLGEELYNKNKLYITNVLNGIPQNFERDLVRSLQGDLRHTQASYIPDFLDGQVQGFFVLVTDITDRKNAELAAIEAKNQAIIASQVKSRFLANMSHEIRTPMNGVLGMLSIALNSDMSSEVREYLEVAKQSAGHLLSIINDILDLSKIEAGEMTLSQEPFSLSEAINTALLASIVDAEKKGLTTSVLLDDQLPKNVIGDSVRLRQVLLNVFNNAIKFTPTGSITLNVSLQNEKDHLIHFQVTDTGIGIPQEKIKEIFIPFRQGDETKTREFGGTGLGLSISQNLVQMMGGKIWVESNIGNGSTFHFTVQLKEVHQTESFKNSIDHRSQLMAANQEPRLHCLIIEDDLISAKIQTIMMQRLNCEVIHTLSSEEGVQLCRQQTFDLILMDLQMPIMDGLEATQAIRSDKLSASQHATIVALTANAFSDDRANCLGAGMNSFLSKPVTIEQLSEITKSYRSNLGKTH